MGSSAWYSELRASLAVPSAESPSTMKSSVRSLSAGAAVGELGRQRRGLQGVLATLGLLVLLGGDPGLGGPDDLLHDQLGLRLLGPLGRGEEALELRRHDLADDGARRRRAEDLLGLALELGLGQPHGHHGRHALEHVVLDHVVVVDLEHLGGAHHVVEGRGDRLLEAAEVGAALGRRDDVDVGAHLGVVGVGPAQRHVDGELALHLLRRHVAVVVEQRHGLGEGVAALEAEDVGHRLARGQVVGELRDAALVEELLLDRLGAAAVPDHQLESRDDVRRLPGSAEEALELDGGVLGEDLPVRPEVDAGARPALGDPLALAGHAGGRREGRARALAVEGAGHAALERDALLGRRAVHVDVHPRRERVDDRQADSVQAAGRDVRAATELAAGVQLGGHDLDAGEPGLGLLVGRDAATVVVDLDGAVGVQRHLDPVRDARQGLVHAVVDDLPQAVHEPAGVGRPDVHAGPLAHGLQALEDEEVRCVVGVVRRCCHKGRTYPRHAVRRRRHAATQPSPTGLASYLTRGNKRTVPIRMSHGVEQ